jgi:hypothetical protein
MKNAVNWFEIYISDFRRAKKFYTEVFHCELTEIAMASERHSYMEYAVFLDEEGKGISGALVRIDEARPGIGGTLIYFAMEEIDAELSSVESAGGKIIRPKFQTGEFGFIALIEDTEGNLIDLRSVK